LYPGFNSLTSPESFVEACQNEIFALGLAAKAVVPLVNKVVNTVNMAKNPAINRFNLCFTFYSSSKSGKKITGYISACYFYLIFGFVYAR